VAIALNSCDMLNLKKEAKTSGDGEENPIARVKDVYLYPSDLIGVIPPGNNAEDSIALIDRHVNNWIKKQLLIAEAKQNLDFDEAEIERKVLDYRYALMMHEFEKIYVSNKINTDISEQEILDYYNANLQNFELDQNIARGIFVQVSREAPKIARFRYLLRSNRPDDFEELKSYCYRFANRAHLEDSAWLYFSDITNIIPLNDIKDEQAFLKSNKYHEISDEEYYYFLKISDYRLQTESSPLEFVADEIRKILLHKRKVAIVKELEENIYDHAIKDEDFEVYIEQ
jgi:hypothetical protein